MITAGIHSIPLNTATKIPALFPFQLIEPRIKDGKRLELFRQGLDNDFVMRVEPV